MNPYNERRLRTPSIAQERHFEVVERQTLIHNTQPNDEENCSSGPGSPVLPSGRASRRRRSRSRRCSQRTSVRAGPCGHSRGRSRSSRRSRRTSGRARLCRRSRSHDRSRSRSCSRDRGRARSRSRDRSRGRARSRSRDRSRVRSRARSRARSRDCSRSRSRNRSRRHSRRSCNQRSRRCSRSSRSRSCRRRSRSPSCRRRSRRSLNGKPEERGESKLTYFVPPTKDAVSVSQLVQALQAVKNKNNSLEKLSNHNTIPEFNPERKQQTIDIWLHKVNECALIYNWSDQQTAHFALQKLQGLAQKWYEGLPTVLYSWNKWQEKLKLAFPSNENYGCLLQTMLSKRAKFNDPLEEYFYEKVVLLNRCNIEGKRAVDCIVHGIDDRSVRLGAEAARFDTPDQLLPYLKAVKTNIHQNDKKKTRVFNNNTDSTEKGDNKNRVIKCYNCLQEGHYKSQCTKPQVKCTRCLKFGHTVEGCNLPVVSAPTNGKPAKTVMCVVSSDSDSTKYYKQGFVNNHPVNCFIDFGSSATMMSLACAKNMSVDWVSSQNLPVLKGFGEAIVRPLGKCIASVAVDGVVAAVEILIVPNEVMRVPLIIGQTYTEQPHIIVEKDSTNLRFSNNESESVFNKIKVFGIIDTMIDGLTPVSIHTDPIYNGDLYIPGNNRYQLGREHYLVQGLFTCVDGKGIVFIKGKSGQPFLLRKDIVIARGLKAKEEGLTNNIVHVSNIELSEPLRSINENDIVSDTNLAKDKREQLVQLLNKYRECFAFSLKELGKTELTEMSINLKDDEPVVYRPYRLPIAERTKVREMIQELLECGIVRPSTSCYASPIVLVKKKSGETRLCIDFRALNRKTIRENYPLPRIDDQLDDLAGYNFYTTLDLASGYYQISISETDRHKTSFVTPEGQYEFNRMPFGLVNAPSTFMRTMHLVLNNNRGFPSREEQNVNAKRIASAYMDDIIVPSVTLDEGFDRLERVLGLIKQANLTLKLSKCCFFKTTVDYLGFELSAEGIRPGTRKIESLRDFPQPVNQHTVRQFIGLCSFFRRFVKNFAMIAKPLTSLLKKTAVWAWGQEQSKAFHELKSELMKKPILALYDPNASTELHTDVCKIGIAGMLMQRDDNKLLKPVAYFSRQTTSEEQHMTAYELETLAVVASLQRFRVYLIGVEFKVITDCNSLRATFLKRDLIPRVARWWIAMQEFNFTVDYKPGASMAHVDALSRNPPPTNIQADGEGANCFVMAVGESDWLGTVQLADSEIQRKISVLNDPQADDVVEIKNNYVVRNSKLYRKTSDGDRWVVPKGVRWQILKQCHDDLGHFGFDKTLSKIKETYWFAKMRRFVKKYVESCLECSYSKCSAKKRPPLHPIPKDEKPFVTVHIDHVGPFIKSSKGNTHLLVIIDAYTKFIVLKPVRSTKSSIVVEKMQDYFSIFGLPKRIISDRGSCFTSSKFTSFLEKLGIKHILNAVATPRANGQVERYNRTLLEALTAKCVGLDERKWDVKVPEIQLGLNNTFNKGIGKTPAQVLFGTSLTGMTEGRVKASIDNSEPYSENKIKEIREEANEYITAYQEKQKTYYDKKSTKPVDFHIGDLVSVEREIGATGQSKKLIPKYRGPYKVVEVLGNDRYRIEDTPITRKGNRKYSAVIAVDKMKAWAHYNRTDSSSSSANEEGD